MTRLANIEKAGYFPLPTAVTDLILTHLTAPHGGRILDPCAGEGAALVAFAAGLGLDPYGVELHEARAVAARQAVDDLLAARSVDEPGLRILHDSYLNLVVPRAGFNCLYLNPPYDHDDEDGRLEYQWLVRSRPWLQPGGLLLWVVPRHLLRLRKAARYIASWYDRVQVCRFPDGEYERFRQVVLFGVLRPKAVVPDGELVERLARLGGQAALSLPLPPPSSVASSLSSSSSSLSLSSSSSSSGAPSPLASSPSPATASVNGKDGETLRPLTAATEPAYVLPAPAVRRSAFHFRSLFIDPADALAEARQAGAATTAAWREHLDPESAPVPLRPLTPLKIGHMNSIIAAGHLNNQLLADDDERLLIKGRSYKVAREEMTEEVLPDGRVRQTRLETETVVTDITTLTPDGQVTGYSGGALEQFLQRWIGPLTNIVAQEYPPVYTFDLNGYGRMLSALSKKRPIPGLNGRSGLLPAQKHAAAAALTRLTGHRDVVIVGEMGSGKTTIAAAVAAGRRARRTIILCPPHLVDKWQREFRTVWPGVRTTHLQRPADIDRFFGDQPDDAPLVGVVKQTAARSASGWEHAYDYGGPAGHSYGSGGYTDIVRTWGAVLSAGMLLDSPAEERPLTERQIRALQQRGIRCPTCGAPQFSGGRLLAVEELKTATRRCSNEQCRAPLYQFSRRRSEGQTRGSFRLYAGRERQLRAMLAQGGPIPAEELAYWTSDRLDTTFGYSRTPLAACVKRQARGRLDLLIVDEVHQYKGVDSDQGYAMHHLAQAAAKVVALTGTIYGGKASSLFHLLFRLAPEMRQAYVDPEATGRARLRSREWVSAYGILQRVETVTLDEDGRQTANSRSNVRYKELPGGSPAMLPWLLNRAVFLSLGDMGFPLPPYSEIPAPVAMAPEQAARYESLREQLKTELKERLVRGDKSLLAGYLHALLFWPDSPRRGKVVRCPRTERVVAAVPGLPDAFVGPKETAILDLCRQEKAAGRKVLLLCQQTDTLDIQPEWQKLLAGAGLKAAVLRAAPDKREAWVARQVADGVDVVISHPRKVETGIDLLMVRKITQPALPGLDIPARVTVIEPRCPTPGQKETIRRNLNLYGPGFVRGYDNTVYARNLVAMALTLGYPEPDLSEINSVQRFLREALTCGGTP